MNISLNSFSHHSQSFLCLETTFDQVRDTCICLCDFCSSYSHWVVSLPTVHTVSTCSTPQRQTHAALAMCSGYPDQLQVLDSRGLQLWHISAQKFVPGQMFPVLRMGLDRLNCAFTEGLPPGVLRSCSTVRVCS